MIQLLKKNIVIILGIILLSTASAAMETLILATMAPLLNAGNPAGTGLPFPFQQILDFLNTFDLQQKLQIIALVILAATLVKNAFVYGNIYCASILRSIIVKHYRILCMQRLLKVGFGYLNQKRGSDVQQILDHTVDNAMGMTVDAFVSIQPHIFTLVLLTGFLFSLSVPLTLLSILLVGVSLIFLSAQAKAIGKFGEEHLENKHKFGRVLLDILQGMKTVRLFGREEFMLKEFEKGVDGFNNAFARMMRTASMVVPAFEICGVVILAAILLVSSLLVVNNPSAYSTLLIFILIWVRIIPPVKAINHARGIFVARLPGIRLIHGFIKEAEGQTLANGNLAFSCLEKHIIFDHITFSYPGRQQEVLKDVSFKVAKGMRVGIVGASGSGKSTMAELLLRFYDPQKGKIIIDGVDIRNFDVHSWRKAIGVVTQDTFVFHDTILRNITFGNPDASKEDVIKAAKRAHAHEFIMETPNGYDTLIGDRGIMLSGGQRQRIAIARAILNEPQILILDEATSALDGASEKNVQEALDEISLEKTVFTIAHRLSTVMNSDMILVFDQGKVVESGSPKELAGKDGFYKKLVQYQVLDGDVNK